MIKEFIEKFCLYILCITIISFPLYVFRDYFLLPGLNFPYPFTFLEVLVLISVVSTLINLILDNFNFKNFRTRFDLFILVFLGTAVLALFQSHDLIGGLGILKAYFIEPMLFFYCLIYQIRKRGSGFIINSLLISGFWVAALALLQKITGTFSFVPNELKQGRVTSVYNSANSLSLYISPILILSLVNFLNNQNLKKIIYLCLFVFMIVILIWTRSRGGVIALSLSLATMLFVTIAFKNRILKKIWYMVPVIILLLTTIFLYKVYLTYSIVPVSIASTNAEGDTLQIRYYIWAGTINLLKEHPVFGAGLNGFKTLYASQYKLPQYPEQFQYPHNLLLTFWAETGIFGLFSFLLILVSAFGVLIKNIHKNKNPILGAGLIAILTYWVLHGVVDVPYFKNDLSMEFFTVLALIIGWVEAKKQNI